MNTKISTRNRPTRNRATRQLSRPSRRGSVLILVVALLVLMALIGTAWISTARVDRAASIETTRTTEAEMLADGVKNMTNAVIVADTATAGAVRRGTGFAPSDGTVADKYLASRVPLFLDEVAPVWNPDPTVDGAGNATGRFDPPIYEKGRLTRVPGGGNTGTYYMCTTTHAASPTERPGSSTFWVSLGDYDLAWDNVASDPNKNPIFWAAVSDIRPPGVKFEDPTGLSAGHDQRTTMQATVMPPDVNGRRLPAFRFWHAGRNEWVIVMAADTDGDGMADANYFKLPIGRVNGLDWYAAVRVVDNNSAANASVASSIPVASSALYHFPSSLNMAGLMIAENGPEYDRQRFDLNDAVMDQEPSNDNDGSFDRQTDPPNDKAWNDLERAPTTNDRERDDFRFASLHELMWATGGRRQRNPGIWSASTNGGAPHRMTALPSTDSAALAYRGGTLINLDAMIRPANAPSSVIERLLPQSLYTRADNYPDPDLSNVPAPGGSAFYPTDVRGKPVWSNDTKNGIGVAAELFARNYDYLNRWAPENTSDPITWHNRRVLTTTSNPVSAAVPSRLVPRDTANWNAPRPGPWNKDFNYDVGDYVTHRIDGVDVLFVCINPVSQEAGGASPMPPGLPLPSPSLAIDDPRRVLSWEAVPFSEVPTRASANAGSFGQLFLGFWQTMAEPATLQRPKGAVTGDVFPNDSQTPFKDAFRGEVFGAAGRYAADLFDSPYFGGRFTAPAIYGGGITTAFPPYDTPGSPVGGPDQHPLRIFRTLVRALPATTGTGFDEDTPRLMTDHTMRLRAALAAVNAIDMRDSDDNVTVREISLGATMNLGGNRVDEADDANVYARVRVYGHERQPFITEVYANTNLTGRGPTDEEPNATGYVAIELYNPYPFAIDLRSCKLATIERTAAATPAARRNLAVTDSLVSGALTPLLLNATSNLAAPGGETYPWVIPANGHLVLENYSAGNASPTITGFQIDANPAAIVAPAMHRPRATGLAPVGAIAPVGVAGAVTRNYAYVPNLHTVLDKEVVLVRPLGAVLGETMIGGATVPALVYTETAAGTTMAVDMAPLDSYDFTGLHNPDPVVMGAMRNPTPPPAVAGQAYAWHYARAYVPSAGAVSKAWRMVYPGRYDAHQTINIAGLPRPRQQGTQESGTAAGAGWNPDNDEEDPWDPLGATPMPPTPGITLTEMIPVALNLNATYYPYEYAIPLTNTLETGAGPADAAEILRGAAGPNAVVAATGNAYPFGGYGRAGDILQVPYIGSYRIKLTPYGVPPLRTNQSPVSGLATQVVATPGAPAYHQVLELNAITMDSVFAEDGDPSNHFNTTVAPITDPLVIPPENIGRFTPSPRDLEVAGAGWVGTATYNPMPPSGARPIRVGNMRDPTRQEAAGAWDGFELVITDGPGKGQVRPVLGYLANGTFAVFPDWETQLVQGQSRYILRRGSVWTETATPFTRTVGNKIWAADLFDYVGVETPQTDFLPAADPMSYARFTGMVPPQAVSTADANAPPAITYGKLVGGGGGNSLGATTNLIDRAGFYTGGWMEFVTGPAQGQLRRVTGNTFTTTARTVNITAAFDPPPVTGDVFRIFGRSEDLVGTEGLVNINTAPWKVLEQLPWGLPAATNTLIAQEIVKYRDGDPSAGIAPHGPFRSVFDLYKVDVFAEAQRIILRAVDPVTAHGDFIPDASLPGMSVRYDFEEQYLLLNRISNLITTRSDTFTVYLLVQGWRDAGDATKVPELVVQRRRAYTADRTGMTPTNKELPIQYIYND